jgi:hypothetical protein
MGDDREHAGTAPAEKDPGARVRRDTIVGVGHLGVLLEVVVR